MYTNIKVEGDKEEGLRRKKRRSKSRSRRRYRRLRSRTHRKGRIYSLKTFTPKTF